MNASLCLEQQVGLQQKPMVVTQDPGRNEHNLSVLSFLQRTIVVE